MRYFAIVAAVDSAGGIGKDGGGKRCWIGFKYLLLQVQQYV